MVSLRLAFVLPVNRCLPRAGLGRLNFALKFLQERLARRRELLLQALSAITLSTRPGLRPVLITAATAIVCVLDLRQFEMFFPIRLLFLQRSRTIADLDPARGAVVAKASVFHAGWGPPIL